MLLALFALSCGQAVADTAGEAERARVEDDSEPLTSTNERTEDSAAAEGGFDNGSEANATTELNQDEISGEDTTTEAGADGSGSDQDSLDDFVGSSMASLMLTGEFDERRFDEENKRVEREIQLCMQAQGFTYLPGGPSDFVIFGGPSGDDSRDEAERVAEDGFGISTGIDEIVDFDFSEIINFEDPNDELLNELSPGEADAWYTALNGAPPEIRSGTRDDAGEPAEVVISEVISTEGCRGQARLKVQGDLAVLDDLSTLLDERQERIDADPDMIKINRSWSECMAEAGFGYTSEAEARRDFDERTRPLMQAIMTPPAPSAPEAIMRDDAPEEGSRTVMVFGPSLTDEQELELAELQRDEIEVAKTSLTCRQPFLDQIEEIEADYEARFVAENRDVLEGLN